MSTPERTHSVDDVRLEDDWPLELALDLLASIAQLAAQAVDGQSLFLLVEW